MLLRPFIVCIQHRPWKQTRLSGNDPIQVDVHKNEAVAREDGSVERTHEQQVRTAPGIDTNEVPNQRGDPVPETTLALARTEDDFELDTAQLVPTTVDTWLESEPREIEPAEWLRYRGYVAEIISALGMDLDTPGTRETPDRFLRALFDSTAGYDGDPKLLTAFPTEHASDSDSTPGQIIEGPIAFSALCEHHALPFFGVAHVGYIAGDQIIGISKLIRLVRLFARRFTVQERLGEQIADTLERLIAPRGVAVHLDASHLCMRMRGVEEDSHTVTTYWRGCFSDADLRREFLDDVRSRSGGR
jgi:GTP cyclohydrolase I